MAILFGFGLADNMFPAGYEGDIQRKLLTPTQAKSLIEVDDTVICLNPSHAATIAVMNNRFDIHCEIPAKAPLVSLSVGDTLIVMGVSGLPRLEGRHEYTQEEIDGAKFRFASYTLK
jgi:hypothetical protein